MIRPVGEAFTALAGGFLATVVTGVITGEPGLYLTAGMLIAAGIIAVTIRSGRESRRARRERLARLAALGIDPASDAPRVRDMYERAVAAGLHEEIEAARRFAAWLESEGVAAFSRLTGIGELDRVFLPFRQLRQIDPGAPGYLECRRVLFKLCPGEGETGSAAGVPLGPLRTLIRAADEIGRVRECWRIAGRNAVRFGRTASEEVAALTEEDRMAAQERWAGSLAEADRLEAWIAAAERVLIVGVAQEWLHRLQVIARERFRKADSVPAVPDAEDSPIAQARRLSLWCVRVADSGARRFPPDSRSILARIARKARALERGALRLLALAKLDAARGDAADAETFEPAEAWLRRIAIDGASQATDDGLRDALQDRAAAANRDRPMGGPLTGNVAALERALRRIAEELGE